MSDFRAILVTGMSGAGRSSALKTFEDLGFEAVDNLPLSLLDLLVDPARRQKRNLAIGIDSRSRAFDPQKLAEHVARLRDHDGIDVHLLFLDGDDEVLQRRFTETRRRHPLSADRPVTDGIALERGLMQPLRRHADLVIDTSQLSAADLRRMLNRHYGSPDGAGLTLTVMSFSYRMGLPREADLVFDMRFLANPYYDEDLRPRTGLDGAVRAFVMADPPFASMMQHLEQFLVPLLPSFEREGKSYLTLAIGCTGGQHRSVVVAEELAMRLGAAGRTVTIEHRDMPESRSIDLAKDL